MDVYRVIITRRPDMAIAYRHLAFVAWESGRLRDAVDVFKRALAAGVAGSGVVTQLGTYLAESGDRGRRHRSAAPGRRRDRRRSRCDQRPRHRVRARRPSRRGACRVFERLLTIDPSNAFALENLGALDLERGDLNAARRHFVPPSAPIRHLPPHTRAWASSHRRPATRTPPSPPGHARSSSTQPISTRCTTWARRCFARGRIDDARPYLERFVRTAPAALYAKDLRDVTALLQSRR